MAGMADGMTSARLRASRLGQRRARSGSRIRGPRASPICGRSPHRSQYGRKCHHALHHRDLLPRSHASRPNIPKTGPRCKTPNWIQKHRSGSKSPRRRLESGAEQPSGCRLRGSAAAPERQPEARLDMNNALIVGAGIAGTILAGELQRHGVDAHLVELEEEPTFRGIGIVLLPPAVRCMQELDSSMSASNAVSRRMSARRSPRLGSCWRALP